jgi:DNA-binding transcriptional regulator GbsR (MarR family)
MTDSSKTSPELKSLAEEVGQFIHYWGFKKIHGRIWTHIFLANSPPDAAALMRHLNVSKALISLSLSDLLNYNVIHAAGKGENGTMTYVANPAVMEIIMEILRNREKKLILAVQQAHENLQLLESHALNSLGVNAERLIMLGTMVEFAQKGIDAILSLGSLDLADWSNLSRDLLNEATK